MVSFPSSFNVYYNFFLDGYKIDGKRGIQIREVKIGKYRCGRCGKVTKFKDAGPLIGKDDYHRYKRTIPYRVHEARICECIECKWRWWTYEKNKRTD